MLRKNSGFSLLELMTVIGILGLVSAIAIPNLIGWRSKHQLGNGARDLLSALEFTRLTAVKQSTATVSINFDYNNDSYSIFLKPEGEVDEQQVRSGVMPAGVDLQEPTSVDERLDNPIVFMNQGLPVNGLGVPNGGKLVVSSGNLAPKSIRLGVGGNAKIESGG